MLFVVALCLLSGCGEHRPPPLKRSGELIVLTRHSVAGAALDEESGPFGFERELAAQFARSIGLTPRFIVVDSEDDIYRRLKHGDAHMAAAWLPPPVSEPEQFKSVSPHSRSRDVLVQHEAALPIDDITELAGRTVHVVASARHASALSALPKLSPPPTVVEHPTWSETDLVEAVANGKVDLALTNALVVDVAANYYPVLQSALELGAPQPVSWLFPAQVDPSLLDKAEDFLAAAKFDGTIARLKDRFFGHIRRLQRGDVMQFIERVRTVLPQFHDEFKQAQVRTGIDWRLLAALAYQESQWEPLATSPTGVRGIMMLTEDTADQLRISNRLDPKQSIRAGARYLADLAEQLPRAIKDPDRIWLALAAYNLGMGHLNGARVIAQGMKADPDSWFELKRVLPLLARPEYYNRLKSGRARGGEAVIMVENIRMFYDILTRHEAPYVALPTAKEVRGGPGLKPPKQPFQISR
jgi:membrane-bound lytic murein transglycosylase F